MKHKALNGCHTSFIGAKINDQLINCCLHQCILWVKFENQNYYYYYHYYSYCCYSCYYYYNELPRLPQYQSSQYHVLGLIHINITQCFALCVEDIGRKDLLLCCRFNFRQKFFQHHLTIPFCGVNLEFDHH